MISLICGFVCFLLWFYWYKRPDHFPPGPRGWPFIGTLFAIGDKNMGEVFLKWRSKYGPVMSVRIGNVDWVVLNNFDVLHKALVRQGMVFSGREITPFIYTLSKGKGIAFKDYDETFKIQRKFGLHTLREFGLGKGSLEGKILEEMEFLTEKLMESNSKPINSKKVFSNAVSNVTCNMVFGKRFEYDDKVFQRMIQIITEAFVGTKGNYLAILNLAFWMRHLPVFRTYYREFLEDIEFYNDTFIKAVEEHKSTFDENNIRDFIDAFLKEMFSESDPSFDGEQLGQYVRDLIEAGTETTSTTLQWCLLALITFPEQQEILREEVDAVIGSGFPSMKHQASMPRTAAFLHEIMRLGLLVPTAIPHKTSAKINFEGYTIPKDTPVFPNLWAAHYDPDFFPNPKEFRPERFIDSEGKFAKSPYVIPFSLGPRHCLGQQLANMELFIFLTRIIQLFDIYKPDNKDLPGINDGLFSFTYSPKPFEAIYKPRN